MIAEEVLEVTLLTLGVAGASTAISAAVGVPAGIVLGLHPGRFSRGFRVFTHALYGMPPVVAGLAVYLLLSRAGPLGSLGILFTPAAMVLAQVVLLAPLVVGVTASSVASLDPLLADTARSLGADRRFLLLTSLREARRGAFTAVMLGFGRAVSEVGAVIIVGGNIRHETRVLTTSIVLETQKGNLDFALQLGLILIVIAALTVAGLTMIQEGER